MKSWRTITAAAALTFAAAPAVFALGNCGPELNLVKVNGLTICVERTNSTSQNVGNLYPWVNSSFFFASYRNMYLYPSTATAKLNTTTIETLHSREVSFTGASVNNYTGGSYEKVGLAPSSTLVTTFSLNTIGPLVLNITGNHVVSNISGSSLTPPGPNPNAVLSDFSSRPGDPNVRNQLDTVVDATTSPNLLHDQINFLGGGNSGFGVWDVTTGACPEPRRAYGSGQFANPNFLTTALGVDGYAYVWVFRGTALPPPATISQQVAEIIRLLLTPESLRCSGIDLVDDAKTNDDAFLYPQGKDYDPIAPRVGNGGTKTGEEIDQPKRNTGWQ